MSLPRVNIFVHILLFVVAVVAFLARIRLPPEVGPEVGFIMLFAAGALFIGNILWLWLSGRLKVLQILFFILAFVVFYIGLGAGLAVNPTLGTVLWIAAGAIVVVNLIWIVKTSKN